MKRLFLFPINAAFDPRYLNSSKLMGDGPARVESKLNEYQYQDDDFSPGM
jgi:hypothetical protein